MIYILHRSRKISWTVVSTKTCTKSIFKHELYHLGQTLITFLRLWTRLFRPVNDNVTEFIPIDNSFSFYFLSLVFQFHCGKYLWLQIYHNKEKFEGKLEPSVFYKLNVLIRDPYRTYVPKRHGILLVREDIISCYD